VLRSFAEGVRAPVNARHSDGNPLHYIPLDLALPAVVEARGARIGARPGSAVLMFMAAAMFCMIATRSSAHRFGRFLRRAGFTLTGNSTAVHGFAGQSFFLTDAENPTKHPKLLVHRSRLDDS